jgi:hypothetical protein
VGHDGEAVVRAVAHECVDVSLGAMAEAEVAADDDRDRVHRVEQHLVEEHERRRAGELRGERDHRDGVRAQLAQKAQLLVEVEELRRGGGR